MSKEMLVGMNPFQSEPKVADNAMIRKFVKDVSELDEKVKDAKEDLREAIASNDDINNIDEQIKKLREERKELIAGNSVIQAYVAELDDVLSEKKDLIADAKQDGIPRQEIELAIKALRKDIDIAASVEIYANIADLIE